MPDGLTPLAVFKTELARFVQPFIRNVNRLEGSPRTPDFEDSLRMEIHDPLWTLCRQWQFGEFQGEDAGSPYQAKILGTHAQPHQIRNLRNDQATDYDLNQPMEMVVEREQLQKDLFLATQMGRHLFKILKTHGLANVKNLFLGRYPLEISPESDDREGLYLSTSLSNSFPDGFAIYEDMQSGQFLQWVTDEAALNTDTIKVVQEDFLRWFGHLYQQPSSGQSFWDPSRLEYSFAADYTDGQGEEQQLVADQYASGHLDWFAFDQVKGAGEPTGTPAEERLQTFIPTNLEFGGMPHPRLWQMEEGRIDFGKIEASPTSLISLLLAEYGLTYSNDWFILPYPMEINTVCEIQGIMVQDVFGQHIFVCPAVDNPEMDWQEYAVFHQTERDTTEKNRNRFCLVPSVGKLMESAPLEKVNFMRDEMSNMVWAIEHTIPSEAGIGRDARRDSTRLPQDFVPAPSEVPAKIRYVLGSTVPENWIPFIGVQKKDPQTGNALNEIRLQRARLPQAPGPKGVILNESQPTYFIEEEEVPRTGVIVERSFQRTRWLNGKTYLWLGRRKTAGRGEGWSGLMFDQIVPITGSEPEE